MSSLQTKPNVFQQNVLYSGKQNWAGLRPKVIFCFVGLIKFVIMIPWLLCLLFSFCHPFVTVPQILIIRFDPAHETTAQIALRSSWHRRGRYQVAAAAAVLSCCGGRRRPLVSRLEEKDGRTWAAALSRREGSQAPRTKRIAPAHAPLKCCRCHWQGYSRPALAPFAAAKDPESRFVPIQVTHGPGQRLQPKARECKR